VAVASVPTLYPSPVCDEGGQRRGHDWVDYGAGLAQPNVLDHALAARKADLGLQHYIPCNLGEVPDYYERFIGPVDVMVVQTCPPDEHGFVNFGANTLWFGAIARRAKTVIVEINEAFPRVNGIDHGLHLDEIDDVIEATTSLRPNCRVPHPPTQIAQSPN
jgi:acyl-CoA hydrolase